MEPGGRTASGAETWPAAAGSAVGLASVGPDHRRTSEARSLLDRLDSA